MAVSNHPSPMFLLGYVFPFFENKMTVWRLLLSVYAPVLLLAFWAQRIYFPKGQRRSRLKPQKKEKKRTAPEGKLSSDQAILSAVEILCKIGGYLMFFSILIVFLRHMDWIPASLRLVLMGAMEMTTGVRETALSLPFPISGAAAAAALTFGGFSGIFQTKAVLPGTILPASQKEPAKADSFSGVSIRSYVCWKLLHAALAAVFFMILGFL